MISGEVSGREVAGGCEKIKGTHYGTGRLSPSQEGGRFVQSIANLLNLAPSATLLLLLPITQKQSNRRSAPPLREECHPINKDWGARSAAKVHDRTGADGG